MESGDPGVRYSFLNDKLRAAVRAEMDAGRHDRDPAAGLYVTAEAAWRYANAADASELDERLSELARRLGLDRLQTAVLGLAAAPQLDPRYCKVYSFLQDNPGRALASPRLIAQLLEGTGLGVVDVVGCLAADAPLRQLGCIELAGSEELRPPIDRAIHVAPEVGAFLLGAPLDDSGGDRRLRRLDPVELPIGRAATIATLARHLEGDGDLPIMVAGPDSELVLAAAAGRGLVLTPAGQLEDHALQRRAHLICALEDRVHAHDRLDALEAPDRALLAATLETLGERTLLCSRNANAIVALAILVEVPEPDLAERTAAWRQLAGTEHCGAVAASFRLSIGQIAKAAELARAQARVHERAEPVAEDLSHGARLASTTQLGELATRLVPVHGWEHLVLAPRPLTLLRSMAAYLRQRDRVLDEWGYGQAVARTQGVKAMFAGESGTGKTMAASVMARELGVAIYRVDLATIVSKYIGETEKNLDRIFRAADGSNAILFFDEADALFGKRSEVSDSHDRYANIEVAYLLQKMEGYAGAVILATNLKQNVDDAFLRRLDFVVVFPFPEVPARRRIWDLMLPPEAPRGDDLDLDFLAERFKLSGGAIRNCSLAAAFAAAEADTQITMEHAIQAVAVEYAKLGRLTVEADFERFHRLLRVAGPDIAVPEAS